MLTMLQVPLRGDKGSDTTEDVVRDGYPYYFKKNNGRIVMARRVPGKQESKNFSLLGQAFGIHEPKRRPSTDTLKKKKKKPVQYSSQPQPPFSAPLQQQQFPNFPPPFAPIVQQQPFPDPNLFTTANSGFTSFYPMAGFPPPPVPVPAPAPVQQPLRWAFQQNEPKPPSVEELLKVESDFLKRAKSKSRRRDGGHNDHTEIKTTTTTTITKHICAKCRRDRSVKYHLDHPIKAGETPNPGFCRRCRKNATSTSGSSDGSDDGESRKDRNRGRGRKKESIARKSDRRQPKSRLHFVEVLSREERRDHGRSNDYRDEIIVEEEVVHERKTIPKDQYRPNDTREGDLVSESRSYTRTREGDLAAASRKYGRTRKEDVTGDESTPRDPKVRINITNRSSSTNSPSFTYETQEKSVRFDKSSVISNHSQAAPARDLRDQYKHVSPLRFATSHPSLPRSGRVSRESLPNLRNRDHAQRRRSERANPERTYDHDTREQVHEPLPRRRSDEDIIVIETEHQQPRSRTKLKSQPRPRPHSSDEDGITFETEHEYPRFRTESREGVRRPQERHRSPVRTPIRTRKTYVTSEIDEHGNKTEFKWTASSSSSSPPRDFIPRIRRPSITVHHHSTSSVSPTANARHSSDSSEEYHRALAMAYQNLPDPGSRRRPRNSFTSSGGGFMDGADTPPQVPDPPTEHGFWEPRDARMSAKATQSSVGSCSTSQSYSRVPQHQSTPRGYDQPWMNAASIDSRNERQEQYSKSRNFAFYDSQESSGSMVTQSDSLRTQSPPDSPEVDTNATVRSMIPHPASVHETTDSGNEVESTPETPSPKAIAKKLVDTSRRQNGRSEAINSKTKNKNHTTGLASQNFKDKLGSYTSYVEYVTPNERNCSNNKAVAEDDDNTTIFDDATDLTLRTARSMAGIKARINARRVSFAKSDQFEPTPEQYKKSTWGDDNNRKGDQSWGAKPNGEQQWGEDTNTNANKDQSCDTTTNVDNSWGANNTSNENENDFWSPNDATESSPDVGSYRGLSSANAGNINFSGATNAHGFNYNKGFAPTTKTKSGDKTENGTGGDGNGGGAEDEEQKVDDEWGPIPTFSSLNF